LKKEKQLSVSEIATRLGCEFSGDGDKLITSVGGLRESVPGDISFLANPKYSTYAKSSLASALIVATDWDGETNAALIFSDSPDASFQQVAQWFTHAPAAIPKGIHSTAIIDETAEIGQHVSIGAYTVISAGVKVGDNSTILPNGFIGEGTHIGESALIYSNVTVREHIIIGDRVILHPGVVIGSDGFGYSVNKDGSRSKVPQMGTVALGNDVEVGSNSCIDRARFGVTRIGNGVKIDNLVQVAHNSVIGDHSVLVAQVGIAGSVVLGDYVVMGGQAAAAGHIVVGANTMVGGQAGITKDIKPNQHLWGTPAVDFNKFCENNSNVTRLPKLKKRIEELEARLAAVEKQ